MPPETQRRGALYPRSRIAVLVFFARAFRRNARWMWATRKKAAERIVVREAAHAAWRLLRGEPVRAITCNFAVSRIDGSGAYEGGGSLIESTLLTIDFADRHGLAYVHAPLRNIDHLPAGMAMADWAAQWENLFNLGKGRELLQGDGASMDPAPFNYETLSELDLFPLLGVTGPAMVGIETARLAKANFNPPHSPVVPDTFTIAVHVRRGEVTPDTFPDRWMEADIPIALAAKVATALSSYGKKTRIIVITHDPALDLSALKQWPTENWADIASLPSLCAMAQADVLIAAISSFSFLAGIVGKGIVIAPQAFRPLEGWIAFDNQGSFDEAQLESQLKDRIGREEDKP